MGRPQLPAVKERGGVVRCRCFKHSGACDRSSPWWGTMRRASSSPHPAAAAPALWQPCPLSAAGAAAHAHLAGSSRPSFQPAYRPIGMDNTHCQRLYSGSTLHSPFVCLLPCHAVLACALGSRIQPTLPARRTSLSCPPAPAACASARPAPARCSCRRAGPDPPAWHAGRQPQQWPPPAGRPASQGFEVKAPAC